MGACVSKRTRRPRQVHSPRNQLSRSISIIDFELPLSPVDGISEDPGIKRDGGTTETHGTANDTLTRDTDDVSECRDISALQEVDHYEQIDDTKLEDSFKYETQQCKNYEEMVKIFRPLIEKNLIVRDILPYLTFLEDEGRVLMADKRSPQLAVTYLLDELETSRELRKWKKFITALESCGYEYIVQNIRGKPFIDNKYQVYYLRTLRPTLSHMIRPREILPRLCAEGIITENAKQEVEQEEENHGSIAAAVLLLDRIPRKGTFWYSKFVQVLKDGNMNEVAEYLDIPELMECKDQTFIQGIEPGRNDCFLNDDSVERSWARGSTLGSSKSVNKKITLHLSEINLHDTRIMIKNNQYVKSPIQDLPEETVYKLKEPAMSASWPLLSCHYKTIETTMHSIHHPRIKCPISCQLESTNSTVDSPKATETIHKMEGPYETPDSFGDNSIPENTADVAKSSSSEKVMKTLNTLECERRLAVCKNYSNSPRVSWHDIPEDRMSVINIPADFGLKQIFRDNPTDSETVKMEQRHSIGVQVDIHDLPPNLLFTEEVYLEPCISNLQNVNNDFTERETIAKGLNENIKSIKQPVPCEEYSEPYETGNTPEHTEESKPVDQVLVSDEHHELQHEISEIQEDTKKLRKEVELLQQKSSITKERANLLRTKCELNKNIESNEIEFQALKQSLYSPQPRSELEEVDALEAEYDLYKLYKRKTMHVDSEHITDRLFREAHKGFDCLHGHMAHTDALKLYDLSTSKNADQSAFSDEDSAICSDLSQCN